MAMNEGTCSLSASRRHHVHNGGKMPNELTRSKQTLIELCCYLRSIKDQWNISNTSCRFSDTSCSVFYVFLFLTSWIYLGHSFQSFIHSSEFHFLLRKWLAFGLLLSTKDAGPFSSGLHSCTQMNHVSVLSCFCLCLCVFPALGPE